MLSAAAPRSVAAYLAQAVADDAHELVDLLGANPDVLCRHLHLPVQSGDTAVLRRMRRAHTAETFASLVERLAARVPGIAIGSDVIVGHPGEDAASFERTRALLEALPLAYLHVFRYSPRERCRLTVPVGMTGLGQLTASVHVDAGGEMHADLDYVARASLALDLRLFARSLAAASPFSASRR